MKVFFVIFFITGVILLAIYILGSREGGSDEIYTEISSWAHSNKIDTFSCRVADGSWISVAKKPMIDLGDGNIMATGDDSDEIKKGFWLYPGNTYFENTNDLFLHIKSTN